MLNDPSILARLSRAFLVVADGKVTDSRQGGSSPLEPHDGMGLKISI
jgi:hypothetical protein